MNIDAPLQNQIPLLRKLWKEAFHDTESYLDAFFLTAFSNHRCRCVTIDNNIISALYWFDCLYMGSRIAYLYAIATARTYRGQGICHKLIKDTHLHLKNLGYAGAILVPGSSELFTFYKKMGYQTCSHINEIHGIEQKGRIPLYQIDKMKYASLRRKLLPTGGVLQENENLDFLQTQVTFYAGNNFLLAAREETDYLYGVELLGDITAIPGIIHSLGYTQGIFRIPGNEKPFAMYYPLGNSTLLPPTYFGLAFD